MQYFCSPQNLKNNGVILWKLELKDLGNHICQNKALSFYIETVSQIQIYLKSYNH